MSGKESWCRTNPGELLFTNGMKNTVLVIALVLGTLPVTPDQKAAPNAPSGSASPNATRSATPATPSGTPSDADRIHELQRRVQLIEGQIAQGDDKSRTSTTVTIIAAIIGAAAVFGSAWVAAKFGNTSQILASERAEKLAKNEAQYRHTEQIIDFRVKQVQNFYAPMSALLRQSKDLYDKMLEQLSHDEPTRYRKNTDSVGSDFRWQVFHKGKWENFYLLDQLPAIKENARALALVDAMLDIGENICEVISSNAGYAAENLVEMLGKYMAHYAILKTVRNGPETEPFEPGFHKVGYFPYGIDTKIREAYHEVFKSIDQDRQTGTETLKILAEGRR
jgi:hypothetical protein